MDTIQRVRFDFQPWRNALPNAAGARLSDAEIYEITSQTVRQSGVLRCNDDEANSWLRDPSVVNALHFTTYVYGDETRKFGGQYRGVHPLHVARRGIDRDRRPLVPSERILTAFHRVNHDNVEDINRHGDIAQIKADREIAMRIIVRGLDECPPLWVGNPGLRPVIQRDIRDTTDPPGLGGKARFRDQIRRVRFGVAPRVIEEFYDDKFDNTSTDRKLVDDGIIKNPAEILARARLARAKAPLIEALPEPITIEEKKAYFSEVENLAAAAKAAAAEVVRSGGEPARLGLRQRAAAIFQNFHPVQMARALSLF